jgi:hypothetical protein
VLREIRRVTRHAPIPKPQRGQRHAVREHHKRQADLEKAAAKRAWGAAVKGVCAMCAAAKAGPKAGPMVEPITEGVREAFHNDLIRFEGHHLIAEADLKRMGYPVEDRFDLRLQLTLCRYHHGRHENFVERVPAELYPLAVYEFAVEHDVMWLLERERDAG